MYAANPGKYRHRVTIEQRVDPPNRDPGDGSEIVEWEVFVEKVPAEVLTGPGREFVAANAGQAETVASINMRWFPGLRPDMRILWDGLVYNIKPPETDSTGRREYRIQCTDGVNDGR